MDPHYVEVALVVISPISGGSTKVLMVRRPDGQLQLPTAPLTNENTLFVAARLLAEHAGLIARVMGSGWVDLVACPLADAIGRVKQNVRVICVPYVCMLPEVVAAVGPDTVWLSLVEALNGGLYMDHSDIIAACCTRLV